MMRDRIDINVSGRKASLIKTIDLPTGNDGSIEVHFNFDDKTVVWSSAIKLAFCAAVTATGLKIMLPAVISADNIAVLPKEVLDIKAAKVYVGVNGTMPDGSREATEMVYIGKTTFGANIDEPFFQPGQIESETFDKFLSDLAGMLKTNIDHFLTKVHVLLEKMHSHTNASTLDKFGETSSGGLLFGGKEIGGIKSLTSFPETAAEGDVVLLHHSNEISVDDSNSGVLLDIPAIVALGLPEGYEQRVWEIRATNPNGGEGFSVTLEIKRIDDYILTGLFLATETIGGRWYWKNGELTTDIAGASTDTVPVHVPLGYVDGFTFTKTLYDLDYWETPDMDDTVIFRTLPLHYSFVGNKWQLAEDDGVADGAIISEVKEIEKDGQKFLQLRLVDSRNKMLDDDIPKYINIPVAAINSVTDSSGGITLNGSELDLGIPNMETRIAALEDALTGATATADEILETIGGEE